MIVKKFLAMFFGTILLFLYINIVIARPVSIQNDLYALSASSQKILFVIHNTSRNSIWLDRHFGKIHPPLSAGWSSEIEGKKWSALILQHGTFLLSCSRLDNNKIEVLNCKKFIKIYSLQFKDLNHNSFSGWLSENHNLFALYHEILQRKIWPKGFYKLFF